VSFTVSAGYNWGDPTIIATPEDVDAFIDELLTADFDTSIAMLEVQERPLNPNGFPDHELSVAVNSKDNVGALHYMGPTFVSFSKGHVSKYDEVVYYYLGNDHEFPRDSDISIDTIRQAVKEFLASGGERPTCVPWQDHRA
jgi:Immunity protein Imm1